MKGRRTMNYWMYGCLSFLLTFVWRIDLLAQNYRQLTVADGLSSSVVTCIHQTSDGMLWLGTLNGVNTYYGEKVNQLDVDTLKSLNGYFVDNIWELENQKIWIQVAGDFYQLNRMTGEMLTLPYSSGNFTARSVSQNRFLALRDDNQLFLYQQDFNRVSKVEYHPIQNVIDLGGANGFCWLAGEKGVYRYNLTEIEDGMFVLKDERCLLDISVKYCRMSENPEIIYVIDKNNRLFQLDVLQEKKIFVMDLKEVLDQRAVPTAVVELNGVWFISFKTAGILRCEYDISKGVWRYTNLKIKAGVFDMVKDRNQELLWIATDGQGVYAYWEGIYSIRSYLYSEVNPRLSNPLRTFFVDERNIFWIGTKGDGLLSIDRNGHQLNLYDCPQKLYTSSNSSLRDNAVYALSASAHGGFWIGTEAGLNFYHYGSGSLCNVPGGDEIEYVHAIKEVGDSVLWIATVGKGVFKATITKSGSTVSLTKLMHFELDEGRISSNYFFNMCETKDALWLANRGGGMFKASSHGLEPFAWPDKQLTEDYNWVYSMHEHGDVLWIVTGAGMVGLNKEGEMIHAPQNGFQHGRIRSLIGDSRGELWTAADNGLSRFSPDFSEIHNYGRKSGLSVTEFSDEAVFRSGETLYFGGMNGWTEVRVAAENKQLQTYSPPLYLFNLKSNGRTFYLNLNNVGPKVNKKVELERDENVFTISCQVMDYLNLDAYNYYYRISNNEISNWIENGSSGTISLAQLQPGNYTLQVKCRNVSTGYESAPVSLNIHVKPDWWFSTWMKVFYSLLFVLLVTYLFYRYYDRMKRRQADVIIKMEQDHKEELYEEKLRFFTNVTHEFCTPLTLIYGPCDRILAYEGTDDFIRKYINVIQKQSKQLYQLIQEIIDYRRIETKHHTLKLESYDVAEYVSEVCDSFTEMAEANKISFSKDIDETILWNMDRRIFPKIVVNLLSNAMKYTPVGGRIMVSLTKLPDDVLQLKVYNTGKGIKEEDRSRIFNRYSVLSQMENHAKGLKSHNGLGMAVCYSSAKLLNGEITINSVVGAYAEFVVELPLLPMLEDEVKDANNEVIPCDIDMHHLVLKEEDDTEVLVDDSEVSKPDSLSIYRKAEKMTVLVVDDNKDILFMLHEMMSDSYEVITAKGAEEAWEFLKNKLPQLIVADVMMDGTDGLTFTQQIRSNKFTMHIPIVILSARNTDEARVEGMNAGADVYITKPFNVQYFISTVNRLCQNRTILKEYYNSSASSQVYLNSQLVKQEDREFIDTMNEVLATNISDCDLTMEKIAEMMNISLRTLYRRLNEMNLPSPKEYIKVQRMELATKLLKTTTKSIQEIAFECGFKNRTNFYSEFNKRYGMTPKEFRNNHSSVSVCVNNV